MRSKLHISFLLAGIISVVCAAESVRIPDSDIHADVPAAWSAPRVDGGGMVLRGPGRDQASTPRIAIICTPSDPAAAAAAIRDGLMRVGDGCEIIDDDQVPLGGRVWHRLRLRFAAGPLAFGQSAWSGSVAGRTVVVVLSAPDDEIAGHLAAGASVVASLRSGK